MTKRNYIKGNPEITPNEVVPKKTTPQKVTSSFFEAPKSYIKQGEFEDMQTFIVIFSGGTTREKNYFSGIDAVRWIPGDCANQCRFARTVVSAY